MEGDLRKLQRKWSRPAFQSTPSAWRETPFTAQLETIAFISIHSLRMEGDVQLSAKILNCRHFNPLPPHGGRPGISFILFTILSFQSTPSAWRETRDRVQVVCLCNIFQSTPSAWRETLRQPKPSAGSNHFNPLPPHGGRRIVLFWIAVLWYFNPLPPHGGRLIRRKLRG